MEQEETPKASRGTEIFAGIGLGILLGMIVGLSSSPVVATVLGALTSLLAVFLGLESRTQGDKPALLNLGVNHLRIGSFGFATVVGILVGLFIRINNPLQLPPPAQLALKDHVKVWTDAFPGNTVLAHQMAIYEWNKLKPEAITYDPNGPATTVTKTAAPETTRAILYSSLTDYKVCDQLRPSRYLNDPVKILVSYRAPGAPKMLGPAADKIEALPAGVQGPALKMTYDLLCSLQREEEKQLRDQK